MSPRRVVTGGCLLALSVVIGGSEGRADVLYDTTWMTDDQSYNSFSESHVSGFAENGFLSDIQIASDFDLADTYEIMSVTSDYYNLAQFPDAVPAGGVLVEFFEDKGGSPIETPAFQVISSDFTVTGFEDTVFGQSGRRIMVDVSSFEIVLEPGTWWVSIVAVDETKEGPRYLNVRTIGLDIGSPIHGRDGGIDHGNGYHGIYGTDDWLTFEDIGSSDGEAAIKVEGTLVTPECPADLDSDGTVGVSDLLSLLASWGPCKGCPADFDGNGAVGVSDLLVLLANWGPCP